MTSRGNSSTAGAPGLGVGVPSRSVAGGAPDAGPGLRDVLVEARADSLRGESEALDGGRASVAMAVAQGFACAGVTSRSGSGSRVRGASSTVTGGGGVGRVTRWRGSVARSNACARSEAPMPRRIDG
jgi:hypothetical protein